jgi:hypothetical protein
MQYNEFCLLARPFKLRYDVGMSNDIDWQRLRTDYQDFIRDYNSRVATTRLCSVCGQSLQAIVEQCPHDDGMLNWEARETLQEMLDI